MVDILAKLLAPVLLPMGVSQADLVSYLNAVSGYLYVILASVLILILVLIGAVKIKKGWKLFARAQAVIAFLTVIVIMVNMICYGPLYNNVSGFLNASAVELADDVVAQSLQTIEKIGAEGIVLAENNGLLPLASEQKNLNVFGWASISPLLGGTGSSASSAAASTDLLQSLENAGYHTNQTLTDMYKSYRSERPLIDMNGQDLTLPEPPAMYYTDDIMKEATEFSDVAVVVIGRCGGEDYDLPMDMNALIHGTYNIAEKVSILPANYSYFNARYDNNGNYDDFDKGEHYLELSNTEEDMIDLVCRNFDHVILVVNASNTMELGWVEQYDQIGAVLLAPAPGVAGFDALGKIISGEVNPSGRTADTFVKDLMNTPYINNIGDHSFTNAEEAKIEIARVDGTYEGSAAFVDYVEGIYTGYKFYETAAEEGLINYEETVQYPFGYGLSYTEFEKSISSFKDQGDAIDLEVDVKNVGSAAGKDVVEIYYTPPYTNGGIEKASVNLIDFAKTSELEPGGSEQIRFHILKEDMASYDSSGIRVSGGGYVLEAGEYTISVRSDAHTVDAEEHFTVSADLDYSETGRSSDQTAAKNQFEEYSRGDFEQLSRKDHFANYGDTCKKVLTEEDHRATEEELEAIRSNTVAGYNSKSYDRAEDQMPATGADSSLMLADLTGMDYDDPKWDELLDKMTFEDMASLVNVGGWQTVAVESIGKVATSDCDGPAGLNNFITGSYGTTFPAEVMMAQTWSKDMAREIGTSIGSEFAAASNFGWYGPAMNIHRSAFAGRNFEYYSEDSVLSGIFAAEEANGAALFGVYPYLKHFALNDQEVNRCGILMTYASEQAIREIYLKPFEIAVKRYEGNSLAVMSSFNWIGTVPSCANPGLLNHVLRGEWGFVGMVETDYDGSYGYMITDHCIRNGNDLMLGYGNYPANMLDGESATLMLALRQSCKNILYTVANSGYYADGSETESVNRMDPLFRTINLSAGAILGLSEILLIWYMIRKRKHTDEE